MIPIFPSSHASFLEIISDNNFKNKNNNNNNNNNNSLILAFFSGQGEGDNGTAIVTTNLAQGSNQWEKPVVRSQRFSYSDQNPVLHYNTSGDLYLFHTQQPSATGTVETNSTIWTLSSSDFGNSFSSPEILFPGQGSYDRNRIILDLQNNWLFPLYNESVGGSVLAIKTEGDDVLPESNWQFVTFPNSTGLVQPTIIRPTPGNPFLRAYFRDRNAQNIYTAISMDDGRSWSDPEKTILPNNNAAIQATVLQSGKVAMVYNPMQKHRNKIVISLSEDQGLSWPITKELEYSIDFEDEFSYPSIVQTDDGMIHVSFTYLRETIKYSVFSESWIEKQDF